MRRSGIILAALALAVVAVAPTATAGKDDGGRKEKPPKGLSGPIEFDGVLDGAPFEIRVPDDWNGTLLVYAHGYRDKFDHPADTTDRTAPGGSEAESAPGGDPLEDALLGLGYALAGSLYTDDGWAVEEGIEETRRLTKFFEKTVAKPDTTILWGFSMGSVVTFASAEKHGGLYDGYIPACAVGAGSTAAYDGALALALAYDAAFGWPEAWGDPGDVRDDLDFDTEVVPVLFGQVSDPANLPLFEFVRVVSHLPEEDFFTGNNWLFTDMFFATEARAELERRAGGPVSTNAGHVYEVPASVAAGLGALGVDVGGLLEHMNATEIEADKKARKYLERYADYKGKPKGPVLALHTDGDGLVPVEHESAYRDLVEAEGRGDRLVQAYVDAVGHCEFSPEQLILAVNAMESWIDTGEAPTQAAFPAALGFLPGFEPDPWPWP